MLHNFAKKWVGVTVKYICKCGHKFTRKNTDWFTMSPLNPKSESENRADISTELKKRKRPCPKCKAEVKPRITNQ